MAAPTNAANVKKALANPEPSTHGTKRTSISRRLMPAFGDMVDKPDAHFDAMRKVAGDDVGVRSTLDRPYMPGIKLPSENLRLGWRRHLIGGAVINFRSRLT